MIRTLIAAMLVGFAPPIAFGQEDQAATAEKAELKQMVAKLTATNTELRQKLREMQEKIERLSANESGQQVARQQTQYADGELAELREVLAAQKSKLAEFSEHILELRAQQELVSDTSSEQLAALESELQAVESVQKELELERQTIWASTTASRAMTNRLAEAQIENRLRLLEAQSMVEVLREKRTAESKHVSPEALAALQKAELLLEQRKIEIELLKKRIGYAQSSEDKQVLMGEIQVADIKYREAAVAFEEAEQLMDEATRQVDERLIEAAIQLSVSQKMERALKEEAEKLGEISDTATYVEQINKQKELLQSQLNQLKREAIHRAAELRAREKQVHSQSLKLEQELLLPLRIQEEMLIEKYGQGHPSVQMLRKQIDATAKQVEDLRAAAMAVGRTGHSEENAPHELREQQHR